MLVAALGVAARAQDPLQYLAEVSPFVPAAAGTKAVVGGLEFRGVVCQGRTMVFSFFDPVANESFWVRDDAAGPGPVIRAFDSATDTVVVELGLRRLVLSLPRAEIRAATVSELHDVQPPAMPIGPRYPLHAVPPDGSTAEKS
ncbi:MAG TPA: hypothetical protein VEB66_01125 [Opitutaceae bacterium]|nr:hypothetical protein [Opitutaceae bacterium]